MSVAPKSKSGSHLSLELQVRVSRCFLDNSPGSFHILPLWLLLLPGPGLAVGIT